MTWRPCALVRAVLRPLTTEVVEADDGWAAWQLLQQGGIAIAILDLQMPGLGGLELARRIKGDPALAGTPVILLTGQATPEDAADWLSQGVDYCLPKPFRAVDLLRAVQTCLEKSA
jgi:two-component system chemotaxis response regulator CheY